MFVVNGKLVSEKSFKVDGVYGYDAPEFVDAYIAYAEFEDGTELDDFELEELNNLDDIYETVNRLAHESFF